MQDNIGYNFVLNKKDEDTTNQVTLLLYDLIGCVNGVHGISGGMVAEAIAYYQEEVDLINIRINSVGGSVIDGYSIISAILNCKVPVDIYVDGLAASIAGVIAMCGTKIHMTDYAMLMLHNPHGNDQKVLDMVKDTLLTILTKRMGMSSDTISEMMDKETWLSAKEALKMGIIDEIIKTDKKVKINKKSSLNEMVEVYNQYILPDTNKKTIKQMILITNKLSLEENASTETIAKSIEDLMNELETEKLASKELREKLDAILEKEETAKTTKVEEMVNSFITSGKLKEDEKEAMVKLALTDFETVKNMLEKVGTVTPVTAMDYVAATIVTNSTRAFDKNDKSTWTIRDYEMKDAKGLMAIKNETPEIYTAMYNDFYKK
jgi:ATP-dependent protease ClpP protease subunit